MRKTKIICTIGPASESESVLTQMCKAGMNVARLNFSHGSHEEHQKKIDTIKKVRKALGLPIAIMLDTKGPEYRIKTFENGKITLKDGDTFTLTTDDIVGNQERVSVTYKNLINNLKVGDHVLINNGLIILEVEKLKAPDAICKVLVGGEVSDKKSMNFPNKVMDHAFLSEQDKKDLLFGIKNDVDFVAASFVSVKKDIEDMRKAAEFRGGKCLSPAMTKGDLSTPLDWECQFGHRFKASPTLVLLGGHWCPECLPLPWNYDEIAKGNPFFAQVWYPFHDKKEHNVYDESIFADFKE